MAWQKNITVTPKVGNDDLRGSFYVPTPGAGLHFELSVSINGQERQEFRSKRVQDSTTLTGPEKTSLVALLAKLRDELLTDLGYTDV